jgi:hypothetical protein
MRAIRSSFTRPAFVVLLVASALPLLGADCATNGSSTDAGPGDGDGDGDGDGLIACDTVEQCPNATDYACLGVCLQICADNTACPLDAYCNLGFCRQGCRDALACDVTADEICVDGNCVPRASAAACGDKCDCDVGDICVAEVCQAPPAECSSAADCPRAPGDEATCNAFACNGFTQECFYPNAPPCDDDDDCVGRPGCTGDACVCNAGGQCIVPTPCTLATEGDDCGNDQYCSAAAVCDLLPSCSDDAPCAPLGMFCNVPLERCERAVACVGDPDCTTAPNTYCDLALTSPACVVPTCLNGGVTCGANLVCNGVGTCVPDTSSTDTCTSNLECDQSPWPNTEYCAKAPGENTGVCTPGCPNNAACPSGSSCDGDHQCVQDGSTTPGAAGEACAETADCQAGLVCHLTDGVCLETCGGFGETCDPASDPNCCDLTGWPICEAGAFLSFCRES